MGLVAFATPTAKVPIDPLAVCSNSSAGDHPFNTGFPSDRSIRYHLPSDCRSHPTRNSKSGCNVVACGLHVEVTCARTCLCPSHEFSTTRQRFLPIVGILISPSSDNTGGASRDDRDARYDESDEYKKNATERHDGASRSGKGDAT